LAEAVDNPSTATRLDPKLAIAHFRLGLAFSRQGRVNEAIAAHRAAIASAPRLSDAHYELGMALYVADRNEAAAEAFDKAAETAPGTSKGRAAAAWALIARNRREEAIISLRRSLALDSTSDALAHLLARTLAEAGRIDEAEQELMKALAAIPTGAGLWQELTTLRRMTPADRPLVERMTGVLLAGGLNDEKRVMLHFALGKLHDDLREFEAAMGHYDAGNRIRAGNRMLDRNKMTRTVDQLIALFPRGMDWEGRARGSDDECPVLIVGCRARAPLWWSRFCRAIRRLPPPANWDSGRSAGGRCSCAGRENSPPKRFNRSPRATRPCFARYRRKPFG
jgi:tetratricopeptide (TPR) repeat protein